MTGKSNQMSSKLVIRKRNLVSLGACVVGIDAFKKLAGGNKLVIDSKEEALRYATAFLDHPEDAEDRVLFLEWFTDETLNSATVSKINQRTCNIMYGKDGCAEPTKKRCIKAARYVAKKMWKHRKRIKFIFKENA